MRWRFTTKVSMLATSHGGHGAAGVGGLHGLCGDVAAGLMDRI